MTELHADQQEECPRQPAATITALTAATCGVLTGFVGSRSADLGHAPKLRAELTRVNRSTPRRGYPPRLFDTPRILDDTHVEGAVAGGLYSGGIEAIDPPGAAEARNPSSGHNGDLSPLAARDRLEGITETGSAPSLHFHESHEPPATRDDVDLLPAESHVAVQELPALLA